MSTWPSAGPMMANAGILGALERDCLAHTLYPRDAEPRPTTSALNGTLAAQRWVVGKAGRRHAGPTDTAVGIQCSFQQGGPGSTSRAGRRLLTIALVDAGGST
eukprot:366310-Chlamydomonas_euryale.AAC.3